MSIADSPSNPDHDSTSAKVDADQQRFRFHVSLLLGALALCYVNSLWGVFVFDDNSNIVVNRSIRNVFAPTEHIPVSLHHRAVARWTFAFNYWLGGLNTTGYHVINIFIHGCVACVLYFLVRDTIRLERTRQAMGMDEGDWRAVSANFACAVALLWLIHPLQTQAVTYISQRIESLMGLFFLTTMYCLLRGASAEQDKKWYVAAVVALSLAVGTKEVAATALPVVLLFDRIFIASSWSDLLRRRAWVYAAFLLPIAGLAWQLFTFHPVGNDAGLFFSGVSRWEYLRTQPQILLHYFSLAFWPRTLCFDYGWPVATTSLQIYPAALAVIAILATSVGLLFYSPRVAFLVLACFLILAPTSSVIPIADLAVEHRMYLPLAALITLTVTALYSVLSYSVLSKVQTANINSETVALTRQEKWGFLLLLLIALPLMGRTIVRNRDYHSDLSLWQSALAARPDNARAAHNVGSALLATGKSQEAIPYLDRALELRANYPIAYLNRAAAFDKLGRSDDAIRDLTRAIDLEPRFMRAYIQRGDIYFRLERYQLAAADYSKHIELDPNYVPIFVKRGITWRKLGEFAKASADFSQALKLSPKHAPALYHRAKLSLVQRRGDEAAKDVAALFEVAPQAGESFALRAEMEHLQGNLAAAAEDFETAIERKPGDASIHEGFAALLAEQKRFEEARTSLETCIKLGGKPDSELTAQVEKGRVSQQPAALSNP